MVEVQIIVSSMGDDDDSLGWKERRAWYLLYIADVTACYYWDLTNCTFLIANKMDCFWPNQVVDQFFVTVHKEYFANCSVSGRGLGDPPNNIIGPFIMIPVMVTLLMTALVVWRSKQNEGIV
ncbi:hypothetical protein chiPu_0014998 [Chiloscyllium punctatum]|uniref:Receptor activity-modifying protein 1 n=1 Tax=Chiloscyllium punctatum TaxID=137246 RepID=A0A401T1K8_CHIPU|nr:hypothetical protein [Chiloscyllium punctatum]